ncbi:methylated-DNA--[protein]-cysteine S-methyltransferase [Microbacter margulisiae]|uniref:Methylated-DNA--protein-cysteine methyltransferase n=1 Tax=Microbacter margulisiae TaxID=1350067 RepID=A0A7W5DNX5_9PORP|nr:methylated-DNA--[protein]-cysteine S-methyltransferase [Microbacter margulisiae]MBB3186090.1 methylated-DNA-[protein]-cysteine S-methyltransferase [Microbacter margulisiae]
MTTRCFCSPVGWIVVRGEANEIVSISFSEEKVPARGAKDAAVNEAIKQLIAYFLGKRKTFSLPLRKTGTAFQQKVWEALQTIPYGETSTYKKIAEQIGHPKAFRAVGNANRHNPFPIVVPCHRVIETSGFFGGYSGGFEIKHGLLFQEGCL